jgi:superfamily I DNA and/or RNA helicase
MDCAVLIELVALLLRRRVLSKSLVGKTESSFLMKWSALEDQRIEPSKSQILGQVQHNVSVNGKGWARALDSSATLTQTQIAGIRTLSTTSLSVRRKVDLNTRFNIVIIDEASQSDIAAAIPLLYRAQRCIVIGDERQLQPIPRGDEATQILAMITNNVADQALDPWTSPHASILTLMQHHLRGVSSNEVMLRDHHRCHPDIIGFSNYAFYERRLRIRTNLTNRRKQDGVHWINVKGEERLRFNSAEAERVVEAVLRLLAIGNPHEEIGIVTPFKEQKQEIERRLRDQDLLHGNTGTIKVDTAHAYQGSERDAMIYSLVVSTNTGNGRKKWASDSQEASHLINVAVTRARKMLIVVGDRDATLGYTRRLHDWISPRQPSKQDT